MPLRPRGHGGSRVVFGGFYGRATGHQMYKCHPAGPDGACTVVSSGSRGRTRQHNAGLVHLLLRNGQSSIRFGGPPPLPAVPLPASRAASDNIPAHARQMRNLASMDIADV